MQTYNKIHRAHCMLHKINKYIEIYTRYSRIVVVAAVTTVAAVQLTEGGVEIDGECGLQVE